MKKRFLSGLLAIAFLPWLPSCGSNNTAVKSSPLQTQAGMNEKGFADSIALLKAVAKPGDLVLRLGDDFLSHQIKYMSQKDPSFSHVGIVVAKNGEATVCHIYPDTDNGDTVRYEAVDRFLNPAKTLSCALYRYDFSEEERTAFLAALDGFAKRGVHFDKLFDLSTDKVYCSEMIYKSLLKATQNRIVPAVTTPPKKMVPLLMKFFAREKLTAKQIAEHKFVSIDNLYLLPQCKRILSFSAKPAY